MNSANSGKNPAEVKLLEDLVKASDAHAAIDGRHVGKAGQASAEL